MPLPFTLPLIPVLKLIALGALKSIFLIIGACFFPRWTLKLIIGGASGMILPVAQTMCDSGCLEEHTVTDLAAQLRTIEHHEFDRREARSILMKLVRKTTIGMLDAVKGLPRNLKEFWMRRNEIWTTLRTGTQSLAKRLIG